MPNKNSPTKYSEEFKKTIVTLYQSGKTYADIKKEYGVSSSVLSNRIRKYSQVQVDEDTVLTAQQIKALQRRNAELEEENLILKKPLQSSRHTQTEIKSCPGTFQTTLDFHPLLGSECEPEYLLQVCEPLTFSQRAGKSAA